MLLLVFLFFLLVIILLLFFLNRWLVVIRRLRIIGLSEFGLHPDSVHCLLIFTIFDDSVVVLTFDALETSLTFREVAKNVLNLLFCEVVCPSLIIPDVKILIQLGNFSLCKPQLSQIVPTVVAEV